MPRIIRRKKSLSNAPVPLCEVGGEVQMSEEAREVFNAWEDAGQDYAALIGHEDTIYGSSDLADALFMSTAEAFMVGWSLGQEEAEKAS